MGPFWVLFGSLLGSCWWPHLGPFRVPLVALLGSHWWPHLCPFWVPLVALFGSHWWLLWGPIWVPFGSLWWPRLGPFRVPLVSPDAVPPLPQVGAVLEELGPSLEQPLARGHHGVAVALMGACVQYPELQQGALRCLFRVGHAPSSSHAPFRPRPLVKPRFLKPHPFQGAHSPLSHTSL